MNLSLLKCSSCTLVRLISTSNVNNNKYSNRQGKLLNKILGISSKKRKWYLASENQAPPVLPTASALTKGALEGGKSINAKRITVLNKLFMRYITDIMATGSMSHEFLGKGIEVSRVQITPNFSEVNVFWLAKGTEIDENIDKTLLKNAGALRHELSQLRVMGVVPKINFVKDKEYAKIAEVDVRLAKADFGEDHIPVELGHRLKSEFTLNTTLPEAVKDQIKKIEESEELEQTDEPLPEMRHDIFGLDHYFIMEKIKRNVKKAQALHRKESNPSPDNSWRSDPNYSTLPNGTIAGQREALASFLRKRYIDKMKAIRELKKPKTENSAYVEHLMEEVENDENIELDDNDYIEEIEDKNSK